MNADVRIEIERAFSSLPPEEKETIIRHGVAFRLSDLKKRLFLAESKVRWFEEKHATSLDRLDAEGLPDDAGCDLHEDYVMWHHWSAVAHTARLDIDTMYEIAKYGL